MWDRRSITPDEKGGHVAALVDPGGWLLVGEADAVDPDAEQRGDERVARPRERRWRGSSLQGPAFNAR